MQGRKTLRAETSMAKVAAIYNINQHLRQTFSIGL